MAPIDIQTTVGELVRMRPAFSRVFEAHRIDYCCGGKIPLKEACEKKGVDPRDIVKRLEEVAEHDADETINVDEMGLAELADHIVKTHHDYLREELPRLDFMTKKVAAVHGEAEPRLHEIRSVFVACREELDSHMMKEEQVLFPMIRELEQADGPVSFHCGSLANPIRMMEHEHGNAGDAMERFAELTDRYTPPDWACNTYRAMVDGLQAFERDMHAHVHKENNVLFPRSLKREQELNAAGSA